MPDRKDEIAWLNETAREIERKNECDCGRGPKKAETEICEACFLEAQGEVSADAPDRPSSKVVDLKDERQFREWLDVMEGER